MNIKTRIAGTAVMTAVAGSMLLATSAPAASAAVINNSPCAVSQLAFQHQAGVGYWAYAVTNCPSRAYNIEVEVKRNGVVMPGEDLEKRDVSGAYGPLPTFSATKGATYQIVEIVYNANPSWELGYATSGTPQVLAQ